MEQPTRRRAFRLGPLRRAYYSPWIRALAFGALDAAESAVGRRDPRLPPRRLMVSGRGDFDEIGRQFAAYLVELGGLRPDERVLDVGCGVGRIALPLTEYLSVDGRYDGFDVAPAALDWCRRNVTPRHRGFRFHDSDVRNGQYNPAGRFDASEYRFPFDDGRFDVAFAVSVFTHMRPAAMRRYVEEMARVVRPGGHILATFFLLNAESRRHVAARDSIVDLRARLSDEADGTGYHTTYRRTPEFDVGHDEETVRGVFTGAGLTIREPISYGYWCGRDRFVSFQDIVVADRGEA